MSPQPIGSWDRADAAEQKRLAALAKAAPVLLAACQAFVDDWNPHDFEDGAPAALEAAYELACDAILAATGRSP